MLGENEAHICAVRTRLLRWYATHKRELPWRRTKDPYAIWVSEIMLQQTRVDTVIPYYERFLENFPSVRALAAAEESDVLALWSGLGYYRRARLLHRGALQVCETHNGQLPRDARARRSISGIGAYTAGAIGSIAFGQEEPIVDGNVKRVLSRLFVIEDAINTTRGENKIWALAEALVHGKSPGDLNQALMELGALVCTPSKPDCQRCPVRAQCGANATDKVAQLPFKLAKKAPAKEEWTAVAALRVGDRSLALAKRTGQRFGGLWLPPMAAASQTISPRDVLETFDLRATLRGEPFAIRHQLTHRDMRLQVWPAVSASKTANRRDVRFVSLDEKLRLPSSSLTHKVLEKARDVLA